MRPFLFLCVAASAFGADVSNLGIGELAKPGEAVEVAQVPARAAAAYAGVGSAPTVFRLSDVPFLAPDQIGRAHV